MVHCLSRLTEGFGERISSQENTFRACILCRKTCSTLPLWRILYNRQLYKADTSSLEIVQTPPCLSTKLGMDIIKCTILHTASIALFPGLPHFILQFILNTNRRTKNGGRPGNEATVSNQRLDCGKGLQSITSPVTIGQLFGYLLGEIV